MTGPVRDPEGLPPFDQYRKDIPSTSASTKDGSTPSTTNGGDTAPANADTQATTATDAEQLKSRPSSGW